jgi:hypothetical protein
MSRIKVSVIVPVHNTGRNLDQIAARAGPDP